MINGAHAIIFSSDADADRAFFKDVLSLRSVDAGGGWLILALPPSLRCIRRSPESPARSFTYSAKTSIAR